MIVQSVIHSLIAKSVSSKVILLAAVYRLTQPKHFSQLISGRLKTQIPV
jgi:hypothetical protein